METGSEVWIAFATASDHVGQPAAWVARGVVLDAEHKVVRRDSGYVGAFGPHSVETLHDTEAAAWRACGDKLAGIAHAIEEEAARCMRRAGSLVAEEAVSV